MKECPYCLKEIQDTVTICDCGYKFEDYKLKSTDKSYKKEKSHTNLVTGIQMLITVSVVLAISFGVFWVQSNNETNPSPSVSNPKSVNKYSGQYSGHWEGFLLDQYNKGTASFDVDDDGSAKLSLKGKFSAIHKGYISGDYFVINSNNEKCSVVDMGDGFKVSLIWAGVNVDVFFNSGNKSISPSYSSCTASGAKSFAKKRINTTIGRTQFLDLHSDQDDKWLFYGSAYSSRYNRDVTVWVLINCSHGSYDVENVEVDV